MQNWEVNLYKIFRDKLETNDLVVTIHHFDGQNRDSFRKWRKDLCRAALENNPVDDLYMRKLVSRTVKDTASDFWSELRTQRFRDSDSVR